MREQLVWKGRSVKLDSYMTWRYLMVVKGMMEVVGRME